MFNLLIFSLVIISIIHFLNRILPFKICALCAGISGAWLLATLGVLMGFISLEEYGLPILMMMGATVVGVAYQGEERFGFAKRSIWHWKIPATIIGLMVFYRLFINLGWISFFIETGLILFLGFTFFTKKNEQRKKLNHEIEDLKQRLNDCC